MGTGEVGQGQARLTQGLVFRQLDDAGDGWYLYRVGTTWWVGLELGKEDGRLKAQAGEADQSFPPAKGWKSNIGKSDWHPYASLECSREPSTPCTEIRVEFKGSASSGVYLPVGGEYRFGRPVFQNISAGPS